MLDLRFRSVVPDLLYEDQAAERVTDIEPYLEDTGAIDPAAPLHRVTVFVTYRCNLSCPYCKTIVRDRRELTTKPQRAIACSLEKLASILENCAPAPVRHLHFTGGEATVHPQLPEMVTLAKRTGIPAVSLTSNGTRPLELYRELAERGLDELRISIDAADPEMGRLLTQRAGAWEATLATLRSLAAWPERRFTLIANTVVGAANRSVLPQIVRLLLEAGVDDLKLITEVEKRDHLRDFPARAVVIREIQQILDLYPHGAYPLLRRKLRSVFASDAIGLDQLPATTRSDFRCYVPLTERTADAVYYYPCSVYLREGGAPLGRLDESPEEQRRKSAEFTERGDCMRDPICRRYCLACTRGYNVMANAARSVAPWFLVITPHGLPQREEFLAALDAREIETTTAEPLADWPRCATAIYARAGDDPQRVASYEGLWSRLGGGAELIHLASARAHRRLIACKSELRQRFVSLELDGLRVHAFHVPDPEDVEEEHARLQTVIDRPARG